MRVAIIGTPRSGNSWVRFVLADIYGLTQIAVHRPADIPAALPPRLVLQLHWYRTPEFQAFLRRENFRIVVLARHPLDVLLSILHFVRHEPQTARWLDGDAALPAALATATPTSAIFRAYARGSGAAKLLGISAAWWQDEAAIRIRYEDLVRAPEAGFARVVADLGGTPAPIAPALERSRFAVFQAMPNRHGWQGQPGLWRSLITPAAALRIYWRHRHIFKTLGYRNGVTWLPAARAARNWAALTGIAWMCAITD